MKPNLSICNQLIDLSHHQNDLENLISKLIYSFNILVILRIDRFGLSKINLLRQNAK